MEKLIYENLNVALDTADREASAEKMAAVRGLATKACSRCGGKGYGYFFGGNRAPGQCFKCGGVGKVFVSGRAKSAATAVQAQVELVRLRACWKAVRVALAATKALPPSYASRSDISELERRLSGYEKAGKALTETAIKEVA